jgi:tetratricopeptide (TPR) repeat protein
MNPALRSLLMLALLAATGCRTSEVVRVVDGVPSPGRFISDRAYAAYALGAEWEARAEYDNALAAYVHAAEADPDNVEVYSRIAALLCLLDRSEDAEDAFASALERDVSYEPTWRRRALCAEREGRNDDALVAAERAVALDPERDGTVILYARLLVAAGRGAEAWPWLRSLVLRSPSSLPVWEAIEQHASDKPAWVAWAKAEQARLQARQGPAVDAVASKGWEHVDEAIVRGDREGARRLARQAHLDVRLLAARAIVLDRPRLALEEAALRVGADPSDVEAHVAMALAADLAGESARASEAIAALASDARPNRLEAAGRMGPVGEALLGELLLRRSGPDVAKLWLGVEADEVTVDALRARARRGFSRVAPKKGME